jgi:DNA-binding HxlR family transcriptional regulator
MTSGHLGNYTTLTDATGNTCFNDIRRAIPRISPSLLSKRLKEMERNGLIDRIVDPAKETVDYIRTTQAQELYPILVALGEWAQRNIEPDAALCDKDARALMWFVRRKIKTEELPERRVVIRFHFSDAPERENTF